MKLLAFMYGTTPEQIASVVNSFAMTIGVMERSNLMRLLAMLIGTKAEQIASDLNSFAMTIRLKGEG
jgi:hypothetical protein